MKKVSAAAGSNNPLEYLGIFSGFDTYAFNNKDIYYQLKYTDKTWSLLCKNGYLIITNITVIILLNTCLKSLEE
jgi:hypothetical protein